MNIKALLVAFIMMLCVSGISPKIEAKTPPEVLEPYKNYLAAIDAKDDVAAAKYARQAWQASEVALGSSETTANLAHNFAYVSLGEPSKDQIKAMERAIEIVSDSETGDSGIYMQRSIKLSEMLTQAGKIKKAEKAAEDVVRFAEENGETVSTFYAEALTLMAGHYSRKRLSTKTVETAARAIKTFEAADDGYPSAYPVFANLYEGFGHEMNEDIFEAAMSYQRVMEYVGEMDYSVHPIVGRALGRWSHMRGRLQVSGDLEDAKAKGLCDCFPYEVERNESVEPIKRIPPIFSKKALSHGVSGYTIIQFDLDDSGQTINPKILVSWPPNLYEKSSLKSLEKWKYTPREDGETDKDRTNLVSTIRYEIMDSSGNPVY